MQETYLTNYYVFNNSENNSKIIGDNSEIKLLYCEQNGKLNKIKR